MMQSSLVCDNEERRHQIRRREGFNGLDYLEVVNPTTLKVYFLKKAPEDLTEANVQISGGLRPEYRDIRVVDIDVCRQEREDLDDCLIIRLDKTGDFSTYTICLVALDENGRSTDTPFPGFDPRYYCLDFNFKVDCASELDCKETKTCAPEPLPEPEINYLAKDYASFRQLILDRLAVTIPDWQETHVPDIGIALVELMAYVGDHLSYYQDAVATEAYLDTARQRISVRRHARLVDYQMHEGCNARAWVHIDVEGDTPLPLSKITFITGLNDTLPVNGRLLTWDDLREVSRKQYESFEPLIPNPETEMQLYQAHNEIHFYTWGDQDCCLPKGATRATLIDGTAVVQTTPPNDDVGTPEEAITYKRALSLVKGDVLIFEEVVGPKTGIQADADRTHRHAVRLTNVEKIIDELYHQPVLEVTWDEADALPFALCISAIGPPPYCERIENISVARGNVLLVDHGRHIDCENLGIVPIQETTTTCETCNGDVRPSDVGQVPGHFRPILGEAPITFSQPIAQPVAANVSAKQLLSQDPRQATPHIKLHSGFDLTCYDDPMEMETAVIPWEPRRDLLASNHVDPHFVAEIDDARQAHLRFGDGELGKRPTAGDSFTAVYRIGNGIVGNVGAEAISHIVADELLSLPALAPRNPLPAVGGVDPEPVAEVKLFAPYQFRTELQRAITPEDYAHIVMRDFATKVQRAAAILRWTGSWYELLVAVDAVGQVPPDAELLAAISRHLHNFRRIGHDLVVKPAQMAPLDIVIEVCVLPEFLRGHVKADLLDRLSNRRLRDGSLGFFHPDKLTFGQGIYLSEFVAAVQAVKGVESVHVTKFERLYEGTNQELAEGLIKLSPLEIARLDNDPNFPENGSLILKMDGGR